MGGHFNGFERRKNITYAENPVFSMGSVPKVFGTGQAGDDKP
jgi:hypothetical protein